MIQFHVSFTASIANHIRIPTIMIRIIPTPIKSVPFHTIICSHELIRNTDINSIHMWNFFIIRPPLLSSCLQACLTNTLRLSIRLALSLMLRYLLAYLPPSFNYVSEKYCRGVEIVSSLFELLTCEYSYIIQLLHGITFFLSLLQ